MDEERFQTLMEKYFESDLTVEEAGEFKKLLKDPQAQKRLAESSRFQVNLSTLLGKDILDIPHYSRKSVIMRRIVAVAALFFILVTMWWMRPVPVKKEVAQPVSFYSLGKDGGKGQALTGLRAGDKIFARAGSSAVWHNVHLQFIQPTILQIASELSADGRRVIELEAGYVQMKIKDSPGVVVKTAAGNLTNLGTEFKVQLNQPIKEKEMIKRWQAGKFKTTVVVLVLSGVLQFHANVAHAIPIKIFPQMGKVKLSANAFIGKIVDREGTGVVKPVMYQRWSNAEQNMPLEPGDWIKTGARGANVLALRMNNGVEMILGPNSLVESTSSTHFNLLYGEIEIKTPPDLSVQINGGEKSLQISGTKVIRSRGKQFAVVKAPKWLVGYKNNSSTEALGSLLANVDGRNVPLTIGYHKVTVDIRDQIARTVVEESFINHTSTTLEGVFYFPLPQDASISQFGMWINGELVHGDIVEKQRAREIYEQILREKRDPGLLEWTGGNIFKVRVFPIHSEKRIKIAYTQVLPKNNGMYQYHYALQSEMLKQHPLQQLQIDIKIHSQEQIARVKCPSHNCRIDTTNNSAHIEFSAEEYTPDRDFELRIATDKTPQMDIVSHRRGDDGYFMLLVNAPKKNSVNARALLEDSKPIDLMIMADTSGSMNGPQRKVQMQFIEALLNSLAKKDRFNLVTCDVQSHWLSETLQQNSANRRQAALNFVEKRQPLGWSDLDRSFAQVFRRIGKNTHVVYVGDGVITAGDADPAAFAERLPQQYSGNGIFHAVATGSSYESVVLQSIARLGGGSSRIIGASSDSSQVAFQLLQEISQPGVKDLQIEFSGLRVAGVYPKKIPNLSAGTQQIIIGRYHPANVAQNSTVTVRGMYGQQKVEYNLPIKLEQEHTGNSFIPRLWARHHLDYLLSQGSSPEVRAQIIALSEDYQIISPYTSFLVLESDADRQRFKVEKRFRMRDGEEFFITGRNLANHELLRKQMLKARRWRLQLQKNVVEDLAKMARESTWHLSVNNMATMRNVSRSGAYSWETRTSTLGGKKTRLLGLRDSVQDQELSRKDFSRLSEEVAPLKTPQDSEPKRNKLFAQEKLLEVDSNDSSGKYQISLDGTNRLEGRSEVFYADGLLSSLDGDDFGNEIGGFYRGRRASLPYQLINLFPKVPENSKISPIKTDWPSELQQLSAKLNRKPTIMNGEYGYSFKVSTKSQDSRQRTIINGNGLYLLSAEEWLIIPSHIDGNNYWMNWVSEKQRGILTADWLLARIRPKKKGDNKAWSAPFSWYFSDMAVNYRHYTPKSRPLANNQFELTLAQKKDPQYKMVVLIDTVKAVIVKISHFHKDKMTSQMIFDDFVLAGDHWWPQQITSQDKDGKVTSRTSIIVEALNKKDFRLAMQNRLKILAQAIVFPMILPEIDQARQAVKNNKAIAFDHWQILIYHAASQRWQKASPHLQSLQKIYKNKWGMDRIQIAYLSMRRDHQLLKTLLHQIAGKLLISERDTTYAMGQLLINHCSYLNQGNERKQILEKIRPIFSKYSQRINPLLGWDQQMLNALQVMRQKDVVFSWKRNLAKKYRYNVYLQNNYAQALANKGEIESAIAYLQKAEKDNGPWPVYEQQQLQSTIANIYWNAHQLDHLVEYLEKVQLHSYANQYLSALIMLNREQKANEWIGKWLIEYRKKTLTQDEQYCISAAIAHSLGQGYNLYRNRSDQKNYRVLADTARVLLQSDKTLYIGGRIIQNSNFYNSDPGKKLRDEIYQWLKSETLSAACLQYLLSHLKSYGYVPLDGQEDWQKIYHKIYQRWLSEKNQQIRSILTRILENTDNAIRIRMYREMERNASDAMQKSQAVQKLFSALLREKWSQAVERELIDLIPRISSCAEQDQENIDLNMRIVALHNFTSWLLQTKTNVYKQAIAKQNEMPRRRLQVAIDEAMRKSCKDVIEFLNTWQYSPEFTVWVKIERVYHQVKLQQDLAGAEKTVRALLTPFVEKQKVDKKTIAALRDQIMIKRCVDTLSYLAWQKSMQNAKDEKNWIETTIDLTLKNNQSSWLTFQYRLLLALDRGDDLEKMLKKQFGTQEQIKQMKWGRIYAYILAERNQIAQATEVMLKIEKANELQYEDYRILADWYLVLNQREKSLHSKIKSWDRRGEYQISNWLSRQRSKYQRTGKNIPEELDGEIVFAFIALLKKAESPANYIWYLRDFYRSTRDFRLLECIPEAVIGHSSQKIYPVLKNLAPIIDLMQEEATLDRLQKHLQIVRQKTQSEMDQRALFLLEFMVENKATSQTHGIKNHGKRALNSLQKAFKGKWQEGEPVMMAEFLAGQNYLKPIFLQKEQLRQLQLLYNRNNQTPYEHLTVAGYYSKVLWQYQQRDQAMDILEAALIGFRQAHESRLTTDAQSFFATYLSYLEQARRFIHAEKVILQELKLDYNSKQQLWLKSELFKLYHQALIHKGQLSFGSGQKLYHAIYREMLAETLQRSNEQYLYTTVNTLGNIWHDCYHKLKYIAVKKDIVDFAFSQLPKMLKMYDYRNGQQIVSTIGNRLEHICHKKTALEFLIIRAESEPLWLRMGNQDFWNHHGYRTAYLRSRIDSIDPVLERRLLGIFLRELREDLRTMRNRSRYGYSIRQSYFWQAKKSDFRKTALNVLKEHRNSEACVRHIATYLYYDLHCYSEAIDTLFQAYRREILSQEGQFQLCRYLQWQKRYKESIPILIGLIARYPDQVPYRTHLMRGYYYTNQKTLLKKTLSQTDAYFRKMKKWNENTIAPLAEVCLETKLFEHSKKYYLEVIALHVKTAHNRGIGDGILSKYYRNLAGAYSGLGNTDEAVNAASAAIISWGKNISNRQDELNRLEQVLMDAEDLDHYVKRLDSETKENGTDNPIVRKALGQVYHKKRLYRKAIEQLQYAVEMQPNDNLVHDLLIRIYDIQKNDKAVARQLLCYARAKGHDSELYARLARRLEKMGDEQESERAFTTMIEMKPNESESHAKLAQIRGQQKRWQDCAHHWRQVIRIRTKEPAGYFELIKVLIQLKKWQEARKYARHLLSHSWDSRFGNVHNQAEKLLMRIRRDERK